MSLRCAVAGLNRGKLFANLLRANPQCELVAVCDAMPGKADEIADVQAFTDFDEMLEATSPDLVAIITPGPQHAPQSLAALNAGAHVLVETPNVYSAEQAENIVALARGKGLRYMLAEDYIYMGWCEWLREIVESGVLGELISARGEYTHDCRTFVLVDESGAYVPFERAGEPGVRPLWRLSDLPPLAYSSHTLGPLLDVMDDRCTGVTAMCGGRMQVAGVDTFPIETAIFTTQNGAMVTLTNGFILGHPMGFFFALYGTTGTVRIVHTGTPTATIATDAEGKQWRDLPIPWAERKDGRDHVKVMLDEFIDSLVSDAPPPWDEARSMDFCLPGVMAHESAKLDGAKLDIPLF